MNPSPKLWPDRSDLETTPATPHLVALDADHPGFRDPAYRARRDAIARLAVEHVPGTVPRDVVYTAEEQRVWRTLWDHLRPAHERYASTRARRLLEACALHAGPIPQLADLSATLRATTGFSMEPVAGLVTARDFLEALAERRFLSTQYIRHPSAPLYTPEPDAIHEIVGHATTLMDRDLADLHVAFGEAARGASDARLLQLERVYWFSVEFGLVREHGEVRALGAGLLSSIGELRQCAETPVLAPFDPRAAADTPYDPTRMQERLFVADSAEALVSTTRAWLRGAR